MFITIAKVINITANIFIIIIIIDSALSFFISPWHPVRVALDRIVNPVLTPIRRIIPLVGTLDLSPLILIILVEILARILVSFFSAL
jgi:YggT family protein